MGIGVTYPAGTEDVGVGAADAAVGDADVDVRLFPGLGRVLFPDHVALAGRGVLADPALELVVCGRHGTRCLTVVKGGGGIFYRNEIDIDEKVRFKQTKRGAVALLWMNVW